MLVSFCIPCYHSEQTIGQVVEEIESTMAGIPGYETEIIMVNDGTPNACWAEIKRLCKEKPESRKGLCLARNFGQHAALMAAIRETQGEITVCLDDDGQTPASEVGKLLDAIKAGADVVYAKYADKKHNKFRNFGSYVNEEMTRILLGKPKELYVSSYFAMRRYVVEEVSRYENSYPYLIGLVLRTTTNIVNVDIHHRERETGRSGYTLKKLLGLWMNGFTAFSVQPLRFATMAGTVFAIMGLLYGIYTVVKKFVNPAVPLGFSSLMAAVVFFGGMQMLLLGLMGEYIGRTYISVNKAPQYVVRNRTTDAENDD